LDNIRNSIIKEVFGKKNAVIGKPEQLKQNLSVAANTKLIEKATYNTSESDSNCQQAIGILD
jgi:hypothetical protein